MSTSIRKETKTIILGYIIDLIKQDKNPYDVSKVFKISRQTINKYLNELIFSDIIVAIGGQTRKTYSLKKTISNFKFRINSESKEDEIYKESIDKLVSNLPENVRIKIEYSLTEMINDVIDHSGGDELTIHVSEDFTVFRVYICDNGVGIFKKIMNDHNLTNEKEAIFELSKGKLTSDPVNHSGEGIFFTSRICSDFAIISYDEFFHSHNNGKKDIIESCGAELCCLGNTTVAIFINKQDKTDISDVFLKFQDEFDGFSKTEVHIKLAENFSKTLISRSQGKRVMSGVKNFKEITLDFKDVTMVGQAFSDEIFRVYATANPNIKINYVHANERVQIIIDHVFKRIKELEIS